ncbi:hypothetical protein Tsubulata_003669, partial [Turnera subulata]
WNLQESLLKDWITHTSSVCVNKDKLLVSFNCFNSAFISCLFRFNPINAIHP